MRDKANDQQRGLQVIHVIVTPVPWSGERSHHPPHITATACMPPRGFSPSYKRSNSKTSLRGAIDTILSLEGRPPSRHGDGSVPAGQPCGGSYPPTQTVLYLIPKQPLPNVLRDGQQSAVVDPFAVNSGHRRVAVSHDMVNRHGSRRRRQRCGTRAARWQSRSRRGGCLRPSSRRGRPRSPG